MQIFRSIFSDRGGKEGRKEEGWMTACFLSQIIYIQHGRAGEPGSDLVNRCDIEEKPRQLAKPVFTFGRLQTKDA